jgi:hypothetical protein
VVEVQGAPIGTEAYPPYVIICLQGSETSTTVKVPHPDFMVKIPRKPELAIRAEANVGNKRTCVKYSHTLSSREIPKANLSIRTSGERRVAIGANSDT